MKILLTGATGNVGISVLKAIASSGANLELYAGIRNIRTDRLKLKDYNVSPVNFDFENAATFRDALQSMDILFLLRPPNLADVSRFFKPLIQEAIRSKIQHIIFLSVQGVEKSKIIPHHKIERLIVESRIACTLLRPAYFMQNFTTTLRNDLVQHQRIFLPARKAKFTLIDLDDVGKVAAKIFSEPQKHINKIYELTNNEILTFGEMAEKLSAGLNKPIRFISPNFFQFFITKRKEKMPFAFILVMIMIHYFPRFQKTQKTTSCVKIITSCEPKSFDEFVTSNKTQLS